MHETSIAKQILDAVLEKAEGAGAKRVARVRGWVAESESLSPSSIALHFEAHARGTPAEGASLELELKHLSARCSCGVVYKPEHHILLCPKCSGTDGELLGTPGLGVDSIEIE
ncbi:MAG: hydrogenase maturation nickel metallochaperone HypA [Polyangiaceae bacterium]|nr:hydrogenase maturation nickel metallochaperone HypA [Polyangiaceae bacterium]